MAGGEVFSRVQIDAQLSDVGRNLTDVVAVEEYERLKSKDASKRLIERK